MNERLLTVPEVAEILRTTPRTVTKWCREGNIPSIRTPGGRYRIPESAITNIYYHEETREHRQHL